MLAYCPPGQYLLDEPVVHGTDDILRLSSDLKA